MSFKYVRPGMDLCKKALIQKFDELMGVYPQYKENWVGNEWHLACAKCQKLLRFGYISQGEMFLVKFQPDSLNMGVTALVARIDEDLNGKPTVHETIFEDTDWILMLE
jgi:hypothetical protein